MNTHEKIRELRTMRNYSQEFMADELRIDTSSYCRIEKGVSPLSIERLHKIAKLLQVNPKELIDSQPGSGKIRSTQSIREIISQLEAEIYLLRKEIDPNQA